MIEVLKRGTVPIETKRIKVMCSHCNSELRFGIGDAESVQDYSDNCKTGHALTIICPVCNHKVYP